MSEEVSISIEIEEFKFWRDLEIQIAMDSFSTISFTAPMEAERLSFRDIFRPFSYKPLTIEVNDERLFTGTLMGVDPVIEPASKSVAISGYAAPAVMGDCSMPVEELPLEFNNLRLGEIATRLAGAFELTARVDGSDGAPFKRVTLEPEDDPASFLAGLARQRNLVMTDDSDGALLFQQSISPGQPVARLEEGIAPLVKVTPTFDPQSYFSAVTGFAPTKGGRLGSRYTVPNPFLNISGDTVTTIRPKSFKLEDTDDADAPDGTNAKIGRMFGNMVSYLLDVPTWRDPNDNLWNPNTTVSLFAPDAMVYAETQLLVRAVRFRQSPNSESASLLCVLPGAFSGELPTEVPWLG